MRVAARLTVAPLSEHTLARLNVAHLAKGALIIARAAARSAAPTHALLGGVLAVVVNLTAVNTAQRVEVAVGLGLTTVSAALTAPGDRAATSLTHGALGAAVSVRLTGGRAAQALAELTFRARGVFTRAARLTLLALITEVLRGAVCVSLTLRHGGALTRLWHTEGAA